MKKQKLLIPVFHQIKAIENIPVVAGFTSYTEDFLKKLQDAINYYHKIAIYGSGNHGLGVAALLNIDSEKVQCFLDLNKMKAGKYSPKTHIPILRPQKENLQDLDAIVIIAPLHQDEIASDLRNKFAFTKDIVILNKSGTPFMLKLSYSNK